jgi:RTX calcium-binding nonapeptide repeat (4 copies)/Kelch motif
MTVIPLALRQRRPVHLPVAFLCLLMLGLAPQASAAGPGSFSPTGSMSVPRFAPAAAPLPDGRVLVAGGGYGPDQQSSAEIFDPATGSFSPTGSMSVARIGATAAPLPGGRVLVAGGLPDLSSAEVFDPATNSFSSAGIGSMSVPREGAAAAPLPDGRVLVAGGDYIICGHGAICGVIDVSSAEVFDPATNSFSSAGIGSMSVPRTAAVAASLPDGRVLVAGGSYSDSSGGHRLSSAEVFDPATGSFSPTGSMSVPRTAAVAAPLPDRVLVAGGFKFDVNGQVLSSAEVFNPAPNTFSSAGIGSMSVPREYAAAAPLPDGRVLVAGPDASAEIFAPVTCRGKQATIVGTNGADRITGTPGADVIVGVGGHDKLSGLAGNDVICGGAGNDTLNGGAGKDQLSGQKGNDKLYGQKGNDKLSGKAGNDALKGGPGKDILKGGAGKDKQVQ